MSATPQPPARIRVITHPPLDEIKVWLPLPTSQNGPPTVRGLLHEVQRLISGGYTLSAQLQGFALLPDSPISVLDPVNDILDIHAGSAAPVAARSAAHVALPSSPTSSRSSGRSSSSGPPPALSSKRPVTNGSAPTAENGSGRPAKRARRVSPTLTSKPAPGSIRASLAPSDPSAPRVSSSESSSASSSSSSSSSSSAASSSSDFSSSSSSSSSSSESESDSEGAETARTNRPPTDDGDRVPPGAGKRRTQKRNLRKRILRKARARDQASTAVVSDRAATDAAHVDTAATSADQSLEVRSPVPSTSVSARDPYSGFDTTTSSKSKAMQPRDQETPPRPRTPLATGGEPGRSFIGAGGGRKPNNSQSSGFFTAPQPAAADSRAYFSGTRGDQSPEYRPKSPNVTYPDDAGDRPTRAATSSDAAPPSATPVSTAEKRAPSFTVPSKRSDLPPHVFVTKVNVEGKHWQPGVGLRVPGTSAHAPTTAASETTSTTPTHQPHGSTSAADTPHGRTPAAEKLSASGVEARWDSFPRVFASTSAAGDLVATKVLELDTTTFMPSVSLKYGRLLAPSASHSLRIELDATCLESLDTAAGTTLEEQMADEEDDDDFYGERKAKPKFGQDLVEEQAEADPTIWEGDWDSQDVRSWVI